MQDGIKGVDEVDVKEESMFVAFGNSKLIWFNIKNIIGETELKFLSLITVKL